MRWRLGDIARLVDVKPERVKRWVEKGWLVGAGAGQGPGHHQQFAELEARIAQRVMRVARKHGVQATAKLFATARHQEGGTHGHGHSADLRHDHGAQRG